jgi:hypothetical protein
VQEAVQSIFFQEAIKPTDEAKREFIFLALLRSHPTLSWIALGFPDGAFFGALKAGEDEIDMVEVKQDAETGIRQQRVDTYTPQPGDVTVRGREIAPSDYEATAQRWYQRAVTEDGPGWSMLTHLPYRDRPAIVTSTPIVINLDFAWGLCIRTLSMLIAASIQRSSPELRTSFCSVLWLPFERIASWRLSSAASTSRASGLGSRWR